MKKYEVDYPIAYHTVDIAITRLDGVKTQVLLIQKVSATENEKELWRFPGGFVDPKDNSAEGAAIREATEETNMKFESDIEYIGSIKINDPRYKDSDHKIITSFFEAKHKSGNAGEGPFDDVARTKWFDIHSIEQKNINPIHADLFNMFFKKHKVAIQTNKLSDSVSEFGENLDKNIKNVLEDAEKGVNKIVDNIKEIFTKD